VANKKYQIFISSTFSDLQEERQLAIKAILDPDHIPSGMEAFPAIDMAQFEYIKKVIDECDYYLLIIGARYGSTDSDGVSFTEREFDYAVSKGKTVIALLHNDVQNLPKKNFDADPTLEVKLNNFRDKVKNGRMVRFWNNRDQLVLAVMQAIVKAIATYPANGWIGGDDAVSEDIVKQYMQLRASYDELSDRYKDLTERNSTKIDNLATLGEICEIRFTYLRSGDRLSGSIKLTRSDIIRIIGHNLYSPHASINIDVDVKTYISELGRSMAYIKVNQTDTNTIKIHFHAIGMLNIQAAESVGGGVQEFVSLTEKGKTELLREMAVKTRDSSPK
jgi:Domain of unknown function (DUF4062)